jgi:hypothetical protein
MKYQKLITNNDMIFDTLLSTSVSQLQSNVGVMVQFIPP